MYIFVILFMASAFSCDCYYEIGDRQFNIGKVTNIESCKGRILEFLYNEYKTSNKCSGNLEIQWSCGNGKDKKVFQCEKFETMLDAEATFVAAKVTAKALSSDISVKSDDECDNSGLYNDLKDSPSTVFDSIDNYSISTSLANDNNILREYLTSKSTSNDLANTHGYNYVIQKALDGKGYVVEVSWNSQLTTSHTIPSAPNYSRDAKGVPHVSQYFSEENLAKILLKKVKDGDKVFWSVGGGIHELNKDDIDRHVLFSGVKQQKTFHEWINDQQFKDGNKNIAVLVYDNVPQAGSVLAPFIEGKVGKRFSIAPLSGRPIKTYVELETGARATGIRDASHATASGSINMDAWLWGKTAARISAGHRTSVYVTGETTNDKFYNVMVGSKNVQVGYRYSENDRKLASYQNPLPMDYAERERDVPNRNDTHMLVLKISW